MEDCVIEGFICPICIVDLRSPAELSSHFEDLHADDKEIYQQLKLFFSKAKQKILKQNDMSYENREKNVKIVSRGTPYSGGIDLTLWKQQTIGATWSHTESFRYLRKESIERCVVESNKLKIRLDKLIRSGIYNSGLSSPIAMKTRKRIEKSVVPWESDQNVKECGNCQRKFSMTYRRHHCRLCGKVVCERCLDNLDMVMASDVLKLDTQKASSYCKQTAAEGDNEYGLKVCDPCNSLLQRENKLIKDKSANMPLMQLYDSLQGSIREADCIQPKYMKMADSLNDGETEFNLEAATDMRLKLLKCYERVEALSKRIQQLGLDKEKQPNLHFLKLQRSIRAYASAYLTENMFILPVLPSAEKYEELLTQKKLERERLRQEKVSTLLSDSREIGNANKNMSGFLKKTSGEPKTSSRESGPIQAVSIAKAGDSFSFYPVQVATCDKSFSAVNQQIEIVKGYLAQAKRAGKEEEVELFEENLRELILLDREQKNGDI